MMRMCTYIDMHSLRENSICLVVFIGMQYITMQTIGVHNIMRYVHLLLHTGSSLQMDTWESVFHACRNLHPLAQTVLDLKRNSPQQSHPLPKEAQTGFGYRRKCLSGFALQFICFFELRISHFQCTFA